MQKNFLPIALLFLALSLVLTGCTFELPQEADAGTSQQATTASETVTDVDTPTEAELAPRLKPRRVLFIGDHIVSSNLGIGPLLAGIVDAADPATTIETEYLASDWTDLLKHSTLDAPAKIREGDWDAVVLQQNLIAWPDIEQFYDGVRALDKIIDETDAVTLILAPRALKNDQAITGEMEEICEQIGAEVDATVVPVGQAWQRLRESDVDIPLAEAGIEATVPGTYLTALVFYHSLYGGEPDFVPFLPVDALPNPAEPSYSMEKMREKWAKAVSEEDAALLQQIAWETVMAYGTEQ